MCRKCSHLVPNYHAARSGDRTQPAFEYAPGLAIDRRGDVQGNESPVQSDYSARAADRIADSNIRPTDVVAVKSEDGNIAQRGVACGFQGRLVTVVFPSGDVKAFFPNELTRVAPAIPAA